MFTDDPQEAFQHDSTRNVLRRDIPWDIYMTARLISDRDLQLLRRYDKKDADYQGRLLAEAGPSYVEAFLTVLKNVTKDETVQYVLAMLEEMLSVDESRAALFHQTAAAVSTGRTDAYAIFLRLLQRNDWFTQEKACLLLTAALGSRPGQGSLDDGGTAAGPSGAGGVEGTVAALVDWLCGQLRRPSDPTRSVPTAVHALSRLLREASVRPVVHRAGCVPLLAPLVVLPVNIATLNVQLLYEACLAVWQLSFHKPAADMLAGGAVVGGLVDIVRLAAKEKLVRVALLALRNLLSVGPESLEFAVVEKGLPKAIENRLLQNWDDADIPELLEWTSEHLAAGIAALSSFERYRKEVLSGQLTWAPLHDQDTFWLENCGKLTDNSCQLLRALLKLIETSRDSTTLAVSCRDLAQFVTFYPHGKGIVTELRGKELVMRLMMHPDPEVQSEALKCVQRILLSRDKAESLAVMVAAA
eukprot:scaffold3.g6497.t1